MRAVVFDCDGTLVDSEGAWTGALRRVLAHHGVPLSQRQVASMIGGSAPEAIDFLQKTLGRDVDAEQVTAEIYTSVLARLEGGVSATDGAIELLTRLKGTRPLGVASNGSYATVRASLLAAGIPDVFHSVVALGPITRPKPAPDLYLESCVRLHVQPADAIAIEDSLRGATAAMAAGMTVVGVGTSEGLSNMCALVVASLHDAQLHDLLNEKPSG